MYLKNYAAILVCKYYTNNNGKLTKGFLGTSAKKIQLITLMNFPEYSGINVYNNVLVYIGVYVYSRIQLYKKIYVYIIVRQCTAVNGFISLYISVKQCTAVYMCTAVFSSVPQCTGLEQ